MSTALYTQPLRRELAQRAQAYADKHGMSCYSSLGTDPAVLFVPSEDGMRHGNFLDETFAAIGANPAWARRLHKAHAQRSALPVERRTEAMEPDSCNSSDALLMNVFCHPGFLDRKEVVEFLGLPTMGVASLDFGFFARVPLERGTDRTEVDLRVADLLVEAKLTESHFQTKAPSVVLRYRELGEVFDVGALAKLPNGDFDNYQLIRNVLAAYALKCRFLLLCDQRRPDLVERLSTVLRAVLDRDLRARCKLSYWQELAAVAPKPLRAFLDEKYGIC
jgi:hypothetical protein